MHTNHSSAGWAVPPGLFVLYKQPQSNTFNSIKILNHAHVIFQPVSFIKML